MKTTIIFDVDGTLLDTEPIYVKSWVEACPKFGYEMPESLPMKTRGVSAEGSRVIFREALGEAFPFHEVRAERIRISERHIAEKTPEELLKPGALEALRVLQERGYRLAVATSTEAQQTNDHLNHTEISEYFCAVVTGNMVARGKPFPDIFLMAAAMAGADPKECIVVGDSPADAKAALAAGMDVILIPDMVKPDAEIRERCAAVLDTMETILPVIERLG